MLGRVMEFVRSAGASSESDSDRDGLFSHHKETHSFVFGVYRGFTSRALRPGDPPDRDSVNAEPVYYRAGYVCGTLLQVGVLSVVVVLGLPVVL